MPNKRTPKTPKQADHNRNEVLSVKASVAEKWVIIKAAQRYRMSYSEFIRYVTLQAIATMDIQAPDGVTRSDVVELRKSRPASAHTSSESSVEAA